MSPASFVVRLAAATILINLSVLALAGLSLRQSQHYYQERAVVTAQNLADVLENELAGAIEKTGVTLYAVKDEFEHQGAASALSRSAMNGYIARVHARLPYIDGLRIADERGRVVYGEDVAPDAQASVADRNHFIRQRDNPDAGMAISRPVSSRVNGKRVIVFNRRLNHKDGSFAGIVLASVTLDHLTQIFSKLDLGKQGSISLLGRDFSRSACYPELKEGEGMDGTDALRNVQEMLLKGQYAGTHVAPSPTGSAERTLSYRKVADYPLYLITELDSADYFAQWRQEVAIMLALAVGFLLSTLLSAGLIYRGWKRRRFAVAALAQQEKKFRTLLEFTPDALVISDSNGIIAMANRQTGTMFGYERQELIGQPVELLLAERFRGDHTAVRRGRGLVSPARELDGYNDWCAASKDGREFFVSICMGSIATAEGVMTVAAIRDITGRKRAEAQLQELNETLESRVGEAVAEARSLARRLLQVQDEERKHLARELHDETGQLLTAASLSSHAILIQGENKLAAIHENAEFIIECIAKTQGAVRDVIHFLRPSLLSELGLADSLRDLAGSWQKLNPKVKLELTIEGDPGTLNDLLNISIYRFVQEGLTNVAKHAEASRVSVRLHRAAGTNELVLSIADNGQGLSQAGHTEGFGLRGMQERATAVGGELTFSNRSGEGFRIVARLPVNPDFEVLPSPMA